jgi:REP element-mobilizing transposase RayT
MYLEKVEIIEAEVCPDHIHILVKMSVWIHRISQKEKYVADTRTAWKFEI